jgi:hypothetical protein
LWAIDPSAAQTIFNGGLYRAQLHQGEAIYNAELATYRQAVLMAFQQVEECSGRDAYLLTADSSAAGGGDADGAVS